MEGDLQQRPLRPMACRCILSAMHPSEMEFQLLALVASRERSGREVAKAFREETGKDISYGSLYTAFRRMREAGWVKTRDEEQDGRVRYFKITATGARALADRRRTYARLAIFGSPAWGGMR